MQQESSWKNILDILVIICIILSAIVLISRKNKLDSRFVYVSDVIENAVQEIRYASAYNFVGRKIKGYNRPVSILTREAAFALKKASDDFNQQGYVIKIFDAYRPQMAVDDFWNWAQDLEDNKYKNAFYPEMNKLDLLKDGYIMGNRSSHSRGSTVDISLIEINSGKELDMGTPFDYFGKKSWHEYKDLNPEQIKNRNILLLTMQKYGFEKLDEEWWHYTLRNEPYESTYFNFPVE